jgi:hypothetical protein
MAEHARLLELTEESIAALKQRGIVRTTYIDWIQQRHRSEHASY